MLLESFRLASYHLPRHLMGLSTIEGMSSPCTTRLCLLVTCPFLMMRLLDFLGLNFILAQVAVVSSTDSIHLACMWDLVDKVKSSMNPLLEGRCIPDAVFGPLVSLLAVLMMRFIPITNRTTETVQPVTMPFSSLCHDVISLPTVNLNLMLATYVWSLKYMQEVLFFYWLVWWWQTPVWRLTNINWVIVEIIAKLNITFLGSAICGQCSSRSACTSTQPNLRATVCW